VGFAGREAAGVVGVGVGVDIRDGDACLLYLACRRVPPLEWCCVGCGDAGTATDAIALAVA
jgi:hypothetical protein